MKQDSIKDYIKRYWRVATILLLCLTVGIVFYFAFKSHERPLRVVFLDIGQGDAIFIESPTGNQIIIDGGPGSTLVSEVAKQMSLFDRSIDMIVVTNPDKDHFEGFIPLLSRYTVDALVEPGVSADENPVYQEFRRLIAEKSIPIINTRVGQKILLGGGVHIDILFPDRDVEDVSHNDGSLVARLVYANTSILLTGDTTKNIENYLVTKYPQFLQADILKVAHHGSETSTTDAFVKAVDPDIAIISAGKGNSYGHPRQATLDTLSDNDVETLVTMDEGSITFESDGETWVRK
jgi:competence protein ComEC